MVTDAFLQSHQLHFSDVIVEVNEYEDRTDINFLGKNVSLSPENWYETVKFVGWALDGRD